LAGKQSRLYSRPKPPSLVNEAITLLSALDLFTIQSDRLAVLHVARRELDERERQAFSPTIATAARGAGHDATAVDDDFARWQAIYPEREPKG
jgi:hypothetical protein